MAQTEKGIIYPYDYNEVADVPADLKALAESIDRILSDYSLNTESGNKIVLEMNNTTYKIKAILKDKDDNVISTSNEIDLPLENVITNITYNNQKLTLTHQDGQTTEVSIADLISDLASKEEVAELQSQVDDLETLVETELDSNTVEGTALDVSDSAEYRGRIEVKGNTYQKQLSGKNLWGGFSYSRTASGVTHIYNKDGTFTINGTATANSDSLMSSTSISEGIYRTFPAGTYTISGGTSKVLLYAVKTNGITIVNTTSTTFTRSFTLTEETDLFIRSRVNEGVTVNNATVYCMVESGSTATDYEPYCGGPSPNPDYPQEIKVVTGDSVVKHVGKNLFDKDNANIINAGISSNKISISEYNRVLYIPVKPSTTYTVQKRNDGDVNRFRVGSCTVIPADNVSVPNSIENDNGTSITKTTGANDKYLAVMYYRTYETVLTEQQILDTIQIEEGSTATSYEPYRGEEYKLDLWKENEFNSTNATIYNALLNDAGFLASSDVNKTAIVSCQPNKTYKISKIAGKRLRVAEFNTSPSLGDAYTNRIKNDEVASLVFKTSGTANYLAITYYSTAVDTLTEQKILNSIQIQEAIELCKIGDYEDILFKNVAGDENYNSELESGAWYKKSFVEKVIFDGSETGWSISGTGTANYFYQIALHRSIMSNVSSMYANKYIYTTVYTGNTNQGFFITSDSSILRIRYGQELSLTDFKALLFEKKLLIYYVSATPIYTKITDSTLILQSEALRKAKWFKGVNHWWTETANLKPNLKGTYKQSNNLRLQALEQAVVALGGV